VDNVSPVATAGHQRNSAAGGVELPLFGDGGGRGGSRDGLWDGALVVAQLRTYRPVSSLPVPRCGPSAEPLPSTPLSFAMLQSLRILSSRLHPAVSRQSLGPKVPSPSILPPENLSPDWNGIVSIRGPFCLRCCLLTSALGHECK
jgi:hypothetical protein